MLPLDPNKTRVYLLTCDVHNSGVENYAFATELDRDLFLANIARDRCDDFATDDPEPDSRAAVAARVLELLDAGSLSEAWDLFYSGTDERHGADSPKHDDDYYYTDEEDITPELPEAVRSVLAEVAGVLESDLAARIRAILAPRPPAEADQEQPAEPLLRVFYKCPGCGHEWNDEHTSACDATCPVCALDDIEALSWEPVDPSDAPAAE